MGVYYTCLKIGAKLLPPWARRLMKKVYSFPVVKMGGTFIPEKRMKVLLSLLEKCAKLEGQVIECGVYRGGGNAAIAQQLKSLKSNKIVYGLDTFEGFPFATEEDAKDGVQNAYKGHLGDTSLGAVQKLMDKKGLENVRLLKGKFDETFPSLKGEKFCFGYIDADIYVSTKQCIEFLVPRMVKGGVLMFDDYNSNVWVGATKAIDEGLGKENLVVLPRKGCYWVKQ